MFRVCGVVAAAMLGATVAPAEAAEGVSLALIGVSDYVFRGVSQTAGDPAAQGAIEAKYKGFTASVWASNVSFADAEIDFAGSYSFDADASSFSLGAVYYAYAGAAPDTNYWEGFAAWNAPAGPVTVAAGVYVSPDFTLNSGLAVYAAATATIPLARRLSLDLQGGRQWIDDNAAAGLADYTRWSAGLAYAFDRVKLTVIYEDTDISRSACARELCGPQVVGGIAVSF